MTKPKFTIIWAPAGGQPGFECPICTLRAPVTNTRQTVEGFLWRRRKCPNGHDVQTVEVTSDMLP